MGISNAQYTAWLSPLPSYPLSSLFFLSSPVTPLWSPLKVLTSYFYFCTVNFLTPHWCTLLVLHFPFIITHWKLLTSLSFLISHFSQLTPHYSLLTTSLLMNFRSHSHYLLVNTQLIVVTPHTHSSLIPHCFTLINYHCSPCAAPLHPSRRE